MKVAIYGGTFDPIHLGHLRVAEAALEVVDKVILVPSNVQPFKTKKPKGSSIKHRTAMLKLVTLAHDIGNLRWADVEIKRGGISYTIDTVRFFKEYYKDAELYLIVGSDCVADFHKWRAPKTIRKLAKILIAPREESLTAFSLIGETLPMATGIASTDIRARVKEERSIKYMVPESVEKYIRDNNLYKE